MREVESRLNQKYPGEHDAHLRIAFSTLHSFRATHLNLKDQVLSDIQEAAANTKEVIRQQAIHAQVMETDAYKEKINAIVDEKLSVQRELVKLFTIMEARISTLYNKVSSTDFIDGKTERLIIAYFEQIISALEKYSKHEAGYKEGGTDVNISVNIASDQVGIIREAVREVLSEVDPALAVRFMSLISAKMKTLRYGPETDVDGVMLEDHNG